MQTENRGLVLEEEQSMHMQQVGGMEPLLSVDQAAIALGISPWTLRSYIRDEKVPVVRVGRRVLIEPATVRRVVEKGRSGQN